MKWRIIFGYPLYKVTESGEVLTFWAGGSKLPLSLTVDGYQKVVLYNNLGPKTFLVHRLVMDVFVGPSDLAIKHINGNQTDNRLVNLEYVKCDSE